MGLHELQREARLDLLGRQHAQKAGQLAEAPACQQFGSTRLDRIGGRVCFAGEHGMPDCLFHLVALLEPA